MLAAVLAAACGSEAPREPAVPPEIRSQAPAATRYAHELIFVGERGGEPLLVPLVFSTSGQGPQVARTARGWLVHDETWDPFLDESWAAPSVGDPWRILPHGPLRVRAGGPTDVEALVYRQGDRVLRLFPGSPISAWSRHEEMRYRLLKAMLEIGGAPINGVMLEIHRVERGDEPGLKVFGALDWLFLTDGEATHLVMAEAAGATDAGATDAPPRTYAWTLRPHDENSWDEAEVRWLEMLPVQPARRDVPVRWSFRIPNAGIAGEAASVGRKVEVGEERSGRRSVEAHHIVEGWILTGEERRRVYGILRHSQE
ncbi:hypothetical protein BH23GEM3_BH23GEM3_24200 [soil metagenome]